MSKIDSRPLRKSFITACVGIITLAGHAQGQAISIRPEGLREGDGKTRNVTLEASVTPGARLTVSVNYSSDPTRPDVSFIPKFVIQDNAAEDRDRQEGRIRLLLPKAFDKTGVYLVHVDETKSTFRFVHEPNNSSYFRQFADWLVGAAGSGERRPEPQSAVEKINEAIKSNRQDNSAIWTAPMPTVGQQIDQKSLRVRITSAVMPAWSPKGNYVACSAWRNGKWIIATYKISLTGEAKQLWQWSSPNNNSSDFSPTWSPNGDALAFVRQHQDQKSDIWILKLDRNYRPKREVKITEVGNVQGVLGWDKDMGVLFETKTTIQGSLSVRQVWGSKTTARGKPADARQIPLSDAYNLFRGGAPRRQTLVFGQGGPPLSVLYEMNSVGKRWTLLVGEVCSFNWPNVSQDGRWLAFDSDCLQFN